MKASNVAEQFKSRCRLALTGKAQLAAQLGGGWDAGVPRRMIAMRQTWEIRITTERRMQRRPRQLSRALRVWGAESHRAYRAKTSGDNACTVLVLDSSSTAFCGLGACGTHSLPVRQCRTLELACGSCCQPHKSFMCLFLSRCCDDTTI